MTIYLFSTFRDTINITFWNNNTILLLIGESDSSAHESDDGQADEASKTNTTFQPARTPVSRSSFQYNSNSQQRNANPQYTPVVTLSSTLSPQLSNPNSQEQRQELHVHTRRLNEIITETSSFTATLRSDLWKDSRVSNNVVRAIKDHNYKPLHFEFTLAQYVLDPNVMFPIFEPQATTRSGVTTYMNTVLRFVSDLQNLAFALHPQSTDCNRKAVELLCQTAWVLSGRLRAEVHDDFYVQFYKLINCVYRYNAF